MPSNTGKADVGDCSVEYAPCQHTFRLDLHGSNAGQLLPECLAPLEAMFKLSAFIPFTSNKCCYRTSKLWFVYSWIFRVGSVSTIYNTWFNPIPLSNTLRHYSFELMSPYSKVSLSVTWIFLLLGAWFSLVWCPYWLYYNHCLVYNLKKLIEECDSEARAQRELHIICRWCRVLKWATFTLLLVEIIAWAVVNCRYANIVNIQTVLQCFVWSAFWSYFIWLPFVAGITLYVIMAVILRRRVINTMARISCSHKDTNLFKTVTDMVDNATTSISEKGSVNTDQLSNASLTYRFVACPIDIRFAKPFQSFTAICDQYITLRDSFRVISGDWQWFLILTLVTTMSVMVSTFVLLFDAECQLEAIALCFFYLICVYITFYSVALLSSTTDEVLAIISCTGFAMCDENVKVQRMICMMEHNPCVFTIAGITITFERLSVIAGTALSSGISTGIRYGFRFWS